MLEVRNLSCGYGNKKILEDISFTAEEGDIVCILGKNGSGKSTLIKSIVGLIPPFQGEVLVNGEDISRWPQNKKSKVISYIPQTFSSMFQYRAIDIVIMGRTPHIGLSLSPSRIDIKKAIESMKMLNILHLKDKIYSQMSGGERQLVKIAQALTQEAKIIVMDEPTNNLDYGNQNIILKHLQNSAKMGITILMVTHFPEQVFYFASKALLVRGKAIVEVERPNENLSQEQLEELYDTKIKLVEVDIGGKGRKICANLF